MNTPISNTDPFIGINFNGYVSESRCGEGAIAKVYFAKRLDGIRDERAIKIIRTETLRETWIKEIDKVTALGTTEGIVPYLAHGEIEINSISYTWMAWKFIKGKSLKKLIEERAIDLPLVHGVVVKALSVLHACKEMNIQHGDLHSGNIIIEDPNSLNIDSELRRVWVTDFGYLSCGMGQEMLDDYVGLQSIIRDCLNTIAFSNLEGRDKYIARTIFRDFLRKLVESNHTEGGFVRSPKNLLSEYRRIQNGPPPEDKSGSSSQVGDYLAAELLGDRISEWNSLFVPKFLGSERIVSRNIVVLTGLRGCGKTTVFRRLTAEFDKKLGPNNVSGSMTFIGFYLNARSIAEAFPWLPTRHVDRARPRIIHFFHCCWLLEIGKWLAAMAGSYDPSWFCKFVYHHISNDTDAPIAGDRYSIFDAISRIRQEINATRVTTGYEEGGPWKLSAIDFLESAAGAIREGVPQLSDMPFYFWLDDYSLPLVTDTIQKIINPVIFRRSSAVIFKIATESIESIVLEGLHGKFLEQEDDFMLVDMASLSIQQKASDIKELVTALLSPRIARNPSFSAKGIDLNKILGETPYSYNELALQLKGPARPQKAKSSTIKEMEPGSEKSADVTRPEERRAVNYHGIDTFCDLWSSSTRELVMLFSELCDSITPVVLNSTTTPLVKIAIQDKLYRNAGAKFRSLLAAATPPAQKMYELSGDNKSYGEHIQAIVDVFCAVADYELQNKTSKNENAVTVKQARRIEIRDKPEKIPDDLHCFYSGLIRYGIFMVDWRGKSAAGHPVPRMVLRSILIPHYTLSFSKRDSISMSSTELFMMLRDPGSFLTYWKSKREAVETPTPSEPQSTQQTLF